METANGSKNGASTNDRRHRFDGFEVDPANRTLLRDGELVPLTGKVFDILLVLADNPGRLLNKDELIEQVWHGDFVEEGNLARNVSTLRKALGDTGKEHKYIVTVQGRGYRFLADVSEVTNVDNANIGTHALYLEKSPKPFVSERLSKKWLWVIPVMVLLIAAAWIGKQRFLTPTGQVKTLAVLPIKPINSENRDQIYEIGIANSLIDKLSGVNGLIVRPLSATRKYSDIEQDPIIAGKEQQVDYVFASNYQIANGKIRITAQLINVQNGSFEEMFKDEEDNANIFEAQDAIALKVERFLLTRFNIERGSIATTSYKTNQDAYRLYISGLYQWNRRTGASLQKAAEYFEQAVKIDPNYAQAFAGLASCYALYPSYEISSPSESFLKAKEVAEKALALDENLAEAHTALAFELYHYEADWGRAETEFKRAIELDPNYATAHHWYGEYLGAAGRFDEAFAEQQIALMLDPRSFIINTDLGWNFYMAGRYDQAITQYRRALEIEPDSPITHYIFSDTLGKQGKYADATTEYFTAMQSSGFNQQQIAPLRQAFTASGYEGFIRERIIWRQKIYTQKYQLQSIEMAQDYTFLNEKNEAFAWLQKAFEKHEADLVFLKFNPAFDNLHSDPRFDQLVQRVGPK